MGQKARKIMYYNFKGGVSKTFIAANTASILASKGYKTLLIDLDPQHNASRVYFANMQDYSDRCLDQLFNPMETSVNKISDVIYPIESIPNMFVAPSTNFLEKSEKRLNLYSFTERVDPEIFLASLLIEVEEQFDYIIIDSNSSMERLLNVNGFIATDYIFVPTDNDPCALESINEIISIYTSCKDKNPKLRIGGIIFVKARDTAADVKALTELSTLQLTPSIPMLMETIFPLRAAVPSSRYKSIPFDKQYPKHDITQCLKDLVEEIDERINMLEE